MKRSDRTTGPLVSPALEDPRDQRALADLLALSLNGLREYTRKHAHTLRFPLNLYADVLLCHLTADASGLRALCARTEKIATQFPQWAFLYEICLLRLALHTPESPPALSETRPPHPLWAGERAFVRGAIEIQHGRWTRAAKLYDEAEQFYLSGGAPKKALRAQQNAHAARAETQPDRAKVLQGLERMLRRARALKDWSVAGFTLHNMSIEYQRLGLSTDARGASRKAIKFLTRAEEHGQMHAQALAQLIDVLLEAGKYTEGNALWDVLHAFNHPAAGELTGMLEQKYMGAPPPEDGWTEGWRHLPPAWRSKLNPSSPLCHEVTSGEAAIVRKLISTALTPEELMRAVYGPRIPIASARKRLSTLVSRLRKRIPGSIELRDGRYTLSLPSIGIRD
jgi:tetratricopeptide (TPR) repeat protein